MGRRGRKGGTDSEAQPANLHTPVVQVAIGTRTDKVVSLAQRALSVVLITASYPGAQAGSNPPLSPFPSAFTPSAPFPISSFPPGERPLATSPPVYPLSRFCALPPFRLPRVALLHRFPANRRISSFPCALAHLHANGTEDSH